MSKKLISLATVISFFCLSIPAIVLAQPSFNVNSTIKPCDDYATLVLQNPWDMSDQGDVNNFTVSDMEDLSNLSFSSGLFNFTTTATGAHFYFISPQVNSLQPVGGRWGENYPIDTSKYKQLTVRMNTAVTDPSIYGLRILWHRGKLGAGGAERTITSLGSIPTKKGFNNYTVDLSGISLDGSSTNAASWTSAAVTGFGLYPILTSTNGQIDYVRLEDPTSCGSQNVTYTSSSSGNNDLLSFYLDDNSDHTDGFVKKVSNSVSAASGDTINLSALTMQPGTYKLVSRFDSDYAALERNNEWDMNESTDVSSTGGISGNTFSSGTFSGTSTDNSPNVFFDIPATNPIDTTKYNKLSLKISRSGNININTDPMLLVWTRVDGTLGTKFITVGDHHVGGDVYQVTLTNGDGWNSTVKEMRLAVSTQASSGVNFTMGFLQIRKTGFVTADNQGSTTVSMNNLTVANPPTIQVLQPDIKGGELFRPWDMKQGDFGFSLNSETATDPSFPAESQTSYLPDVRSYEGVRGDLYKVANVPGNGDPNDFFTFPFIGDNRYTINADEYTNICIKMNLNRDYNLTLGSVTKHFYKKVGVEFDAADAWATIYDRWSGNRWYEYCLDAANHPTESGVRNWSGTMESLRMDPHEFSYDNCCDSVGNPFGNPLNATTYYDYFRLAKRDTSYGKYTLVYQTQDSDTASPTVTWSYSANSNFSSPTGISSGDLSCSGRVCIWNTGNVADGDYYVKGTVTDGVNTNANIGGGTVKIKNGQGSTEVAPVLALENPTAGRVVCNDMQIKGYAVNNAIDEPVVAVQVFFDGVFQEMIVPNDFSPASKAAYPNRLTESGFNFTLPVGGLADGSRLISIRAYSSNGGVATNDVLVQKQSGCSDTIISDNSPAGSPVPGTVGGGGGGTTPTPGPTAPVFAGASLNAKGLMGISFKGVSSAVSGCTVDVSVGLTAATLTDVKTFAITADQIKKKKIALQASGFKVNKSKIKSFFVGAKYTCSGTSSSVTSKSVSPKTSSGSSQAAQLVSGLKKKLKVPKPPKKKKSSR